MYKYFKELENPDKYKIYFNSDWNTTQYYGKDQMKFTEDFYSIFSQVSMHLEFIDSLIECCYVCGQFEEKLISDKTFISFLGWKDEQEEFGIPQSIKEKMQIDEEDMNYLLDYYSRACDFLKEIYPEYRDFFSKTLKKLNEASFSLYFSRRIVVKGNKNQKVAYTMPNLWFITPNGYLYNCNGKIGDDLEGHKGGNLNLAFENIENFFKKNKILPDFSHIIDEMNISVKNGYILESNFRCYFPSIYKFPSILTKEKLDILEYRRKSLELEIKNQKPLYDQILLPNNKHLNIKVENKVEPLTNIKREDLNRSYQPKVLQLYIGWLNARYNLYQSFSRLNVSNHKKENLDKIYSCSWDIWDKYVNTLIRFSKFHKVESCERKITTSSLYGVELFKAYLDKGWDLYIVPPIVYDSYIDDVAELDFHSYYVEKHFDQVLSDYDGKGRVLVRDINC